MLYLIKNHQGFVKIGYSKDLENRLKAYISHGAEIEVIDTCIGTTGLERRLQAILYHKGLRLFGEWFKNDPIIYRIWEMAKNRRWKPALFTVNNQTTAYDFYIYDERDVRENYREGGKIKIVKPKIGKCRVRHWTEDFYSEHYKIK